MEGIKRLEPSTLDSPDILPLHPLINFLLLPTLTGEHTFGLSFGHSERWVYYAEGKPIGLLVISVIPQQQTGVVEWMIVDEKHRNQGIATQLFSSALAYLKTLKILALSLYFPKNAQDSPAIESLLKKFHWAPSKLFVQKYKFNAPEFNPPWLSRNVPIPPEYTLFPWKELSTKEIEKLEHRFDQYQIPTALTPFQHLHLLDYHSSVGIRSGKGVVGWVVNHWIDKSNIEFSSLYIEPDLARTGLGVAALAHSIKLVKTGGAQWAWMTIRVRDDPIPSWSNFIRKRLAGEAVEIQDIHTTFLNIT